MNAPLRVNAASLSSAAASYAELAAKLASAKSAGESGPSWLVSSAAVTAVHADAETFIKTMASRLTQSATDLVKAGSAYTNTDAAEASNLDVQVV